MKTEKIRFDEVIVRQVPPSIAKAKKVRRLGWDRRMASLAFKKFRRRIIDERGVDIVQAIPMDDCIEVRFRGEVECMVIEKKKKGPRRLFTDDEIRMIRQHNWNEAQVEVNLGKIVPHATLVAIKRRNSYKDVE